MIVLTPSFPQRPQREVDIGTDHTARHMLAGTGSSQDDSGHINRTLAVTCVENFARTQLKAVGKHLQPSPSC